MRIDLDGFIQFLVENSGITGRYLDGRADKTFFKRYGSTASFFQGAAEVVTAPVLLSVVAVEAVFESVFYLFKSVYDLAINGSSKASKDLQDAAEVLFAAVIFSVLAALSPIINLVDFVGAGVKTLFVSDKESLSAAPSLV